MTPALRRDAVAWVRQAYRVSEQRACRIVGATRSNVRYRSRRPPQTALRTRLKELATTHVSYGYLRLHVLLRREGWPVNRKRVYRISRGGTHAEATAPEAALDRRATRAPTRTGAA